MVLGHRDQGKAAEHQAIIAVPLADGRA